MCMRKQYSNRLHIKHSHLYMFPSNKNSTSVHIYITINCDIGSFSLNIADSFIILHLKK